MLKATARKMTDPYKSKLKLSASHSSAELPEEEATSGGGQASPQKLSLKGSQLGGSILIGNYNVSWIHSIRLLPLPPLAIFSFRPHST